MQLPDPSFYQLKNEDILFEDNHLIAICKKAGWIIQEDESGDLPLDEMVKNYLANKYNKPNGAYLGVVHRIDRPVSGVVLFAKTSKALERVNKMFKERLMHKTYLAIVKQKPSLSEGNLQHWLIKNPKKNITTAYHVEVKGSQFAELNFKTIGFLNGYYVIEVSPITGRPHQIRVQLASLGSPIVGDNKYGYPRGSNKGSICLHARKLEFLHPIKKEPIKIVAPLPHDGFWNKFETLI